MNRLRQVISNTLISFLGQAVSSTSALVLTVAYGHFLNVVQFGELYLALTIIALLGTPIEAGYGNQVIRDVAQHPNKALDYFSNIFLIKLGIWPILYFTALFISWLSGYSAEVTMLIGICGITLLTGAIVGTLKSIQYAFEQTKIPTVSLILEKGLTVLFCVLLLKLGAGVEAMALVMLAASFVSMLYLIFWFFRTIGIKLCIDLTLIRQILRTNIPFLIQGVLFVSYDRIDAFLLSLMASSTVIGWYGAAIRLFDTLDFVPTIVIFTIMYPIYSKLSTSSEESFKLVIEKSVNFLLFCSIPVSTLMIVAAPNIIEFLYYRSDYTHSIFVLQVLAPGLVFLYVNFPLSTILMSLKHDKKLPVMAAIALVFTLGLNLILIPVFQQVGAAIVTTLNEVLLFCVGIVFVPRHLLPRGSLLVAAKALIASLVMTAAILPLHAFNILVIVPVATLVYLGTALLIGVIPREDYQAVYSALRQKVQPGSDLISKDLPDTPLPSSDHLEVQLPSYYSDPLFQVELAKTLELPAMQFPLLQVELAKTLRLPAMQLQTVQPRSLKAVRLQPLPCRSLAEQANVVHMGEACTGEYITNREGQ